MKPILFSQYFKVREEELSKLGVFDPTLNIDSLLFPDPLLLERSSHPEMKRARDTFEKYFERVMLLVRSIREPKDKVWRTAFDLLSFPEVKGTCLGYGTSSIAGSGSGPDMAKRLLETGVDVVRLGIDDPDLFMAMGLFEKDFGPDLIGDMLTNITLGEIIEFNHRVLSKLGVPTKEFEFKLKNRTRWSGNLVVNPLVGDGSVPVLLMPMDILRALPIATDWREVQQVAAENEEFRSGLNKQIAELWSKKTLESKERLKAWALSSPDSFGSLLDMLHGHDGKPYDFVADRHGEIVWRTIADRIVAKHPLAITKPKDRSASALKRVVEEIIQQFAFLIEKRDLWRELYAGDKPRFEKSTQRIFYAIAMSYCEANDVDITPEAESGRGPVDFKFSVGMHARIIVEIKLSTNKQLLHGYEKQLDVYGEAERPIDSYYVVVDVGDMKDKARRLADLRQGRIEAAGVAPQIVIIDGLPKKSASIA